MIHGSLRRVFFAKEEEGSLKGVWKQIYMRYKSINEASEKFVCVRFLLQWPKAEGPVEFRHFRPRGELEFAAKSVWWKEGLLFYMLHSN